MILATIESAGFSPGPSVIASRSSPRRHSA